MIKTAYDKATAETYDAKRFKALSGKTIHNVELGLLKEALSFVSTQSKVLEVGCGTGRLLVEVCNAGYGIEGLDASLHMLTQCYDKLQDSYPKTDLILGEAARIPCLDDSYDFVYAVRVLNQTGTPNYALNVIAEMIRVAKPGGYVLVEFMNYYRLRLGGQFVRLGPTDVVARVNVRGNARLRPKEAIDRARHNGANLIWCRGALFFGMTTFHVLPDLLIGFVSGVDQFLSRLFPRLCSRCYALFQKMG